MTAGRAGTTMMMSSVKIADLVKKPRTMPGLLTGYFG
jgi:hypothetical protein